MQHIKRLFSDSGLYKFTFYIYIEFSAIHYVMKFVGQDLDYVAQSDDERVRNMQDVDKLAELLSATR